MQSDQLIQVGRARLTHNYSQLPIVLSHGEGCYVWDSDGNRYLDMFSGIAVNALGHNHPRLVQAVSQQARKLLHVSNIFFSEPQVRLAAMLAELSFADRVFFANSGAEANEAALKLVRRYMREVRREDRFEVITMLHSFHGRTMATVTATGQEKYHKGFEPLVPGFKYAKFNDISSIKALIGPQTAAVMIEPVQGEGGVWPADPTFMRELRQLCDEKGLLLVFDEVQTGIGRCGTMFAYQHYDVVPDLMTLAKGLGGGVPIGAMLCREAVSKGFVPGSHASTFGGNPLACQAALATLETIQSEELLTNCEVIGRYLLSQLSDLANKYDFVVEARGIGLLLGLELSCEAKPVVEACMKRGVLLNAIGSHVLRFAPSLIIQKGQARAALQVLTQVFDEIASKTEAQAATG
ncbi:MAG: acetylornithine transaminase [Myxococcales bacterium]|nr:acetylornithine transaminase [Myxococcales bacterium]